MSVLNTRLVLLPGLDGTGDLFAPFVAALDGIHTQVISYPCDRAMNYAAHEAHARAQLPRDADFVLLGESFSGPIAIAIAASPPPGLKALVLCASFAANPLPVFGPLNRLVNLLPIGAMPPLLAEPWLYAGRGTPELRRMHGAAVSRVASRVWRARLSALLAVDERAALARIEVPILYLRATRDRLVPASASRKILAARPDVELTEIDGPHMLLQTEPRACAAAIVDFMQRRSAAAEEVRRVLKHS